MGFNLAFKGSIPLRMRNVFRPSCIEIKTKLRIRIAYWLPKATNTLSEYVILIAFPLEQWLHERASLLRYMYIACLVWL